MAPPLVTNHRLPVPTPREELLFADRFLQTAPEQRGILIVQRQIC